MSLHRPWKINWLALGVCFILGITIVSGGSDDIFDKRPKRPGSISQKSLIEARDGHGIRSLEPHEIYSNENSNMNSVGLSESVGVADRTILHIALQGPNVCTKQEP